MDVNTLQRIQQEMAQQVITLPDNTPPILHDNSIIFTLDIQYVEDAAYVALDVMRLDGEHLGIYGSREVVSNPYVPGLFCFREGPPLKALIEKVENQTSYQADLIIVDGHGLAHPRLFGVACWLGVELDRPTIGCAKRTLVKYDRTLATERGSTALIIVENKLVGYALRTQDNVKPLYVSVGHKISLKEATDVILKLAQPYRVTEPVRRADQAARALAKGETPSTIVVF